MTGRELEVENLKVVFASNGVEATAVNGVSFGLNAGETLAIVGESGCGKTATALSILRLIPDPPGRIVSGAIRFQSRDILAMQSRELRGLRGNRIAMIFQEPMTSLNPVFSIGGQIAEALRAHVRMGRKEARARAVDLLKRVDIPSPEEKMDLYPHQLSGGMRQRVMIAMALSCNPRILIADEPTTALDVLIQAQILDLLKDLKRETGMSILLITHDLGVVAEMARSALVMYAGEIVESGPALDVFRSPLHPYTLGLTQSVPRPGGALGKREKLVEIKGNVPSLGQLPPGCPFHPRCPSAVDRCKIEKPALREIHPGRRASCWLREPLSG